MQQKKIINQPDLSSLTSVMLKYDIGTITAFHAASKRAENLVRNRKLLSYLLGKKYNVTRVKGYYIEDMSLDNSIEIREEYFFVADQKASGTLLVDLKNMGNFFGKDSILFKPLGEPAFLIGTSDRTEASPAKNTKVQFPQILDEKITGKYFSRVKGHQFILESAVYIPPPDNMGGMQGLDYEFGQINSELLLHLRKNS